MSNIIQAPCGLRLDGNNFSVEKNSSGGGHLTSNSPFIITFLEEDESFNISFDDAKELVKTTPIKFVTTLKVIKEDTITNTFEQLPVDIVQQNKFTDILLIPSYWSNPYKLCDEFEPKDIEECFFIKSKNSDKTEFIVWTRNGIKEIGMQK